MKQILAFIITIMLFFLWQLPAYLIVILHADSQWAIAYLPIFILTFLWGLFLHSKWEDI